MTSVSSYFTQKSCLLPHCSIKVTLRSKIAKLFWFMIDIQQLTSLISAFRVKTEKSAIKWVQCQTCLNIAEREQIMQYGLWQDYGTGRETPLVTVAILAEPRNANAAAGSPESITPQSHEHQGVLRGEHWQGILWHPDAIGTGLRQIIEIWSIIIVIKAGHARASPVFS